MQNICIWECYWERARVSPIQHLRVFFLLLQWNVAAIQHKFHLVVRVPICKCILFFFRIFLATSTILLYTCSCFFAFLLVFAAQFLSQFQQKMCWRSFECFECNLFHFYVLFRRTSTHIGWITTWRVSHTLALRYEIQMKSNKTEIWNGTPEEERCF